MSIAPAPVVGRPVTAGLTARAGARVPWGAVLGFAVPLAFTNTLVVVVVRVATGSILRTSDPFVSWVRESVLMSPVYVVLVLLALAWSQRLPHPPTGRRATVRSLMVLGGSGATAGMVWLGASIAYDYRLEVDEVRSMPAMIASCSGACLDRMDAATASLQLRALAVGAVLLLVGNAVVVVWCWAWRGGTVMPATRSGKPRAAARGRVSRRDDVRLLVMAALLGTAGVHAAVVPEHFREWFAAGVFFVVLAGLEVGAAVLVTLRPDRWTVLFVAGLSLAPLVLWAYSRWVGLPFGPKPGAVEAVGVADLAADLLGLVALAGAVTLLGSRSGRHRPASAPHTMATAVAAVVAVTALGLGGSGLGWVHVFGVTGGHGAETAGTDAGPTSGRG